MRRFLPVLALTLLAFAPGCFDTDGGSIGSGDTKSPGDTNGPENSKGTILRVRLTDAPYPYESISSADITVDAVEIRMNDGFHTLPVDAAPVSMNLLALQNGVTEMLVDTEVPVGTIDQIRLIISDASVTLSDGRVFDLTIPSGSSSGLKVSVSPAVQVVEQLTTELLLDFDVSQSFEPIPASATEASEINRFKFHPVLRVSNVSQTGSVSGIVLSDQGTSNTSDDVPLLGATVTSDFFGAVQGSTASGEQGFFRMSGLSPGTQTIVVEAAGFNSASLEVTVVAGNESGDHVIRMVRTQRGRSRTSTQF